MLFASTELAARIERAEARLTADTAAAVASRRPEVPVSVREIGGGVAAFAGAGSLLNKVSGLGFGGPIDPDEWSTVERMFAERETPVQVELSTLADPALATWLTRRGYTLVGFENVLGCGPPPPGSAPAPTPDGNIDIAISDLDEMPTWTDVVVSGFAAPDVQGVASHESFPRDEIERVMGDMSRLDDWVRHLARRDGVPIAGASMRLCDGIAQLCGAATLPAHRRHGAHSAMLAVRLAFAGASGCDVAVMTTQPGSKSQENAQKRGFQLLYPRAVLVSPMTSR